MWHESVGIAIEYALCLVEIVAWPTTVLVALFVLRKPISKLLTLVQRIRYKDLDVEFTSELDQTEEQIADSDDLTESAAAEVDRIAQLIDVSPEAAVLEAWKRVEDQARRKIMELLPESDSFVNPDRRPIDYLDYKGALSPRVVHAARTLRRLRNQAAHAIPQAGACRARGASQARGVCDLDAPRRGAARWSNIPRARWPSTAPE